MLTAEQNELLTRVGPGTPLGELMRRYWVPALLSWELAEPDCPPVTIKLLGEELVAFRQTDGRVGIVGARCAHRRAHLFWGRNEDNGIRCVYHGWKFDCEGRCVDMPSEPEESNFKEKVRIPAYPTCEIGGVVWAYMGPVDKQPPPPHFAWTQSPPEKRAMSKVWQQCNWLQALEGGIDTVHSNFLHGGKPPGVAYDEQTITGRARNVSLAPLLEIVPTDYGYCYAGLRDLPDDSVFVKAYHWVMPWYQIRNSETNAGHIWVPMDDENTMVYNWTAIFEETQRSDGSEQRGGGLVDWNSEAPPWFRDARRHIGNGNEFGVDVAVEANFRSFRNADNRYEIDRQLQKTRTYTGITGTNTQDRAIQESMGPVADRTLERLGTTDRAIINARRSLLKAIRTVQDGGDPPGTQSSYYSIRAYEAVLPKGVHWFDAMKTKLFMLEERDAASL
jgi:phenylpropionate dioxygenase-like ring-hydroxylating dioxygenase large terminal subunit